MEDGVDRLEVLDVGRFNFGIWRMCLGLPVQWGMVVRYV